MTKNYPQTAACCLLALAPLFMSACNTLEYRSVQDTFEVAVQADNPQGEGKIFTQDGYADVAAALTDEYIAELDPRLQPNAYLLRSMSYWRMGDLDNALKSATAGDGLQQREGSRDHVLLALMRSLIAFTEAAGGNTQGNYISVDEYNKLFKSFKLAMEEWDVAMGRVNASTPASTRHYLYFQRWRMIATWNSSFILRIDANGDGRGDDADTEARDAANAETTQLLRGITPVQAVSEANQAVPQGPLRVLMDSMNLD